MLNADIANTEVDVENSGLNGDADRASECGEEPARTRPDTGLTQTPKNNDRQGAKSAPSRAFKSKLVEAMPNLRRFAYRLCGRADMAEDLAQEAMMKAWAARARYKPGSSLKAWAYTILRNTYLSQMRRRKFKGEYNEIAAERILSAPAEQRDPMHLIDLQRALGELPQKQREAVLLVGAGGLSYDEAGNVCDCASGTMKSRVSRGRKTLTDIFADGVVRTGRDDVSDAADVLDDILLAADQLQGDHQRMPEAA